MKFKWKYCLLCKTWMIICPKCGNNCCNAGYGTVDGKDCDVCPSAYDYQDTGTGEPKGIKSAIGISIEWIKSRGRLIKHFFHHGTFSMWKKDRWKL